MKNIDKIKQMNVDELTKLFNNKCQMCKYEKQICNYEFCHSEIKKWLETETLTVEDIESEFETYCEDRFINESCDISNSCNLCKLNFVIEHFNIVDGKINRRK